MIVKIATLLVIGGLVAGCSKSAFDPEMKGMAFWEPPKVVESALKKRSWDGIEMCFSQFITLAGRIDLEAFQIHRNFSMGIPELMASRVTDGYKTLARKEDLTSVKWYRIDALHADGSFDFDSFYGRGRVVFKAIKMNGEWVVHHMEIPRKNPSDGGQPYVVFDFSEAKIKTLMRN
jgi:hypothetical protein